MHFFHEKKEGIHKEVIEGKEEKYIRKVRGCSSYGRAFASHARGKGIDTPHLHKIFEGEKGISDGREKCESICARVV